MLCYVMLCCAVLCDVVLCWDLERGVQLRGLPAHVVLGGLRVVEVVAAVHVPKEVLAAGEPRLEVRGVRVERLHLLPEARRVVLGQPQGLVLLGRPLRAGLLGGPLHGLGELLV